MEEQGVQAHPKSLDLSKIGTESKIRSLEFGYYLTILMKLCFYLLSA